MGQSRRVGFAPPQWTGGTSPTLLLVIIVFFGIVVDPIFGDELLDGFLSPPDSVRPSGLRNDTDIKLDNYNYVEWEPLKKWNPDLGYFYATYHRQFVQRIDDTEVTFFHVKEAIHMLGRRFSVVTDEPKFYHFHFVQEDK